MGLDTDAFSVNELFPVINQMARKMKMPTWGWVVVGLVVLGVVIAAMGSGAAMVRGCPGSGIYCPGVGCVSGQDKCFPGAKGGASKVFSKETFSQWPGIGFPSIPPVYGEKETFVSKKCPDGTRSDGPCLMEF